MRAGGVILTTRPRLARASKICARDPANQALTIGLMAGHVAGGAPPDPASVAVAYAMVDAIDSAAVRYERGVEQRTELTLLTIWDAFCAPPLKR